MVQIDLVIEEKEHAGFQKNKRADRWTWRIYDGAIACGAKKTITVRVSGGQSNLSMIPGKLALACLCARTQITISFFFLSNSGWGAIDSLPIAVGKNDIIIQATEEFIRPLRGWILERLWVLNVDISVIIVRYISYCSNALTVENIVTLWLYITTVFPDGLVVVSKLRAYTIWWPEMLLIISICNLQNLTTAVQ